MSGRLLTAVLAPVVVGLLAPIAGTGQTRAPQGRAAKWTLPHTSWGDPDLQGIWNNVTLTPLERPAEFKDKPTLTPQEAAAETSQ